MAFSALWLMVLVVFWPQLNTYYNCMAGANTVTTQQACHSQFTSSVGGEMKRNPAERPVTSGSGAAGR